MQNRQKFDRLKVKRALLDSDLNQRNLCSILGLSENYVSQLINGRFPIPKDGKLLSKIANILHCKTEKLISGGSK